MRKEIVVEQDGCVLEFPIAAKARSIRVWINGHEMKEGFGNWLQCGSNAILFDSAIGAGNKIVLEYETKEVRMAYLQTPF